LLVGGGLKLEQLWCRLINRTAPPGSGLSLLRHLCTARDRFRLYRKVHRYAVSGGVAITERYPTAYDRALVGPEIPDLLGSNPSWLGRMLGRREAGYYDWMLPADATFVLRLDPELAVARKQDEPADYVRARGRLVWDTDWSRTGIQVIDASRSLDQVLDDLKTRIWASL
jgi:hypothetical protein